MTSHAELAGECPSDLLHRPLPEHGHEVIPRGLLEVAISIGVDRDTQNVFVGEVAAAARAAAVTVTDCVDGAEGGSRQSHHHGRVIAHRLWDALATRTPAATSWKASCR